MFCKTEKLFVNLESINILHDVSININMEKTTAIIGKNGSGKTTLLKCLNGLIDPTSGYIKRTYNKPLPMLFQKPVIFDKTLEYNFKILSKIKKIQANLNWYNFFELDKISKRKFSTLSGGEKQKTFLSRIMSINPEIIIMDEPNQNLDRESDEKLVQLLLSQKKLNKTIIFTSHDYKIVKSVSDKIILLESGKIIFNDVVEKFNYF